MGTMFKTFAKGVTRQLQQETTTMSADIEERATHLAAVEAQRSRKLGRDLIIHILTFAVFISILFLQRDVATTRNIIQSIQNSIVTNQIDSSIQPFPKTYFDIGQWEEYRDFIKGLLVPGLTVTQDYSGRNLSSDELWMVEYVNRVVGAVRVRQLRVANDTCHINRQFSAITKVCYNKAYNDITKDTRPFGPRSDPEKYVFTENSGQAPLLSYSVSKGFWDSSGYVVDIPVDENLTSNFDQLIEDDFYGPATRAIIITINLVSPNYVDRGTTLYLLTEFSAAGQAFPFAITRTFRISLYSTRLDSFRAFLECVFVILFLWDLFHLVRDAFFAYGLRRFKVFMLDIWNWLEIINLTLYFISAVMYLSYLTTARTSVDLSGHDEYLVEFERLAQSANTFYQITAISILLSAFKTFKYLQLNPRLYVLWETLYDARFDMVTYMVMFLIILIGFLFFGWLTFGPDIEGFNGFVASLGTLWQFLIGNPPDYGQLSQSNRVLGPVYYSLFTIFVFFILVNMFVAIIGNSYEVITTKLKEEDSTGGNVGDIKKPFKRMARIAKAFVARKPLYSEVDLLRMLRNREIMQKESVTKQEFIEELKSIGEEPLTLYIERLESIHAKRKKFLKELEAEEVSLKREAMEDEYDRRLEAGKSVSNLAVELSEIVLEDDQIQQDMNNNNNNNNNSNLRNRNKTHAPAPPTPQHGRSNFHQGDDVALEERVRAVERKMESMENKMDSILSKLDAVLSK
eukprot:TRINITY_DN2966_c0_g1_i2.p1 TRINITY_DN2966_c0_g1~~TRINITY_DN2966_c0_g1_i2.p1  ORF type:complete len:742 (-),score=165.62 TRINITY_DN2966_c0_g1_i2:14-2239(-)